MELIFLRHGEPAWAVDGVNQPDPRLTTLGQRQAALAAHRLADDQRISEVLVSPALRAQETAAPLLEAIGQHGTTIDDLVEIRMPDWDGLLEIEVLQIFTEARDRDPAEWWEGLPGGESFRDFHTRVVTAFADLLVTRGLRPDDRGRPHLWHLDDPDQRIVVVAHGGTNAVAIGWLLGADPTPWEWERFILGHASIASLRAIPLAGEHVFSMRTFNDREHIPQDERTR